MEYGKYRGISLVAHIGNLLLKIFAGQLMSYVEKEQLLPEAHCEFCPGRSTIDMMFVIRRLQELDRKEYAPLYMCSVDLHKAYDSVDRVFLWAILDRFDVPPNIISIIRQLHDRMQACVRLDDSKASEWFKVCQGVQQGCVLASLLLYTFLPRSSTPPRRSSWRTPLS